MPILVGSLMCIRYMSRLVRYRGRVHGGHGAFREFVETILAEEGVLDGLIEQFS